MLQDRETYLSVVGIAREPAGERKKWFGRVLLALLVAGIGWLLVNRVASPPDDSGGTFVESPLPGPI